MRFTLRVDDGTGPRDVTVGPAALCGWEAEHGRSVVELASSIGMLEMTELAYRQLTLDGAQLPELDRWRAQLVDLEPVSAPDPT